MFFRSQSLILRIAQGLAGGCLLMVLAGSDSTAVEVGAPSRGSRPAWTASKVMGSPEPSLPYTTEQVFADVSLDRPTEMIRVPGTPWWIVTQVNGEVLVFRDDQTDRQLQQVMHVNECVPGAMQAMGIVFHPDQERYPYAFISLLQRKKDPQGAWVIRVRVDSLAPPRLDASSAATVFKYDSGGHTGGSMHFGPDGYLYVSVGDAQPPNPPDADETGQDLSDLEASILRIDVSREVGGPVYTIPESNPFVGRPGVREEIWAFGFRNPWKMSFSPTDGSLWTGDVGWEMQEMVYRVKRGANYGWSIKEGSQVIKADQQPKIPITPPIVEHSHIEARSVTGGYVWTSDRIGDLKNAYIYGDWMTGKVWGLRNDRDRVTWHRELADTPLQIICFALDADGEVLLVGYDGTIHRLVPQFNSANTEFPSLLSETGLFRDVQEESTYPGVWEYNLGAHHWADGTWSRQWIALPGTTPLERHSRDEWTVGQAKGSFDFPSGSVLAKTVYYDPAGEEQGVPRRLETQLLHRWGDAWRAYNYVWKSDQSDAVLQANEPSTVQIQVHDPSSSTQRRTQRWTHNSRDQCLLCHIWRAGTVHGFQLNQLTAATPANRSSAEPTELARLIAEGVIADPGQNVTPIVSPHDNRQNLEARVRTYLHLNCAHCHRRGGGGSAAFTLISGPPLKKLGIIDAEVTQGGFGIKEPRVVAAGEPERSVLLYRMVKGGRGHMPQFGTSEVDRRAVRLIHDWIQGLGDDSESERDAIAETLESADVQSVEALASDCLQSTETALNLAIASAEPRVSATLRQRLAELAAQTGRPEVADLFEPFLPADQRVERLGASIDLDQILALEGNADAGRSLFFESAGVSCKQCHRMGERPTSLDHEVGPNLATLDGKRTRREILESIVDPSAKVEPKYQSQIVLTVDGQVLSGLLRSETDETIELIDSSGKLIVVAADDVDAMRPSKKSLMPEQLLATFTAQQAADLLAFLIKNK
ncbi:MAG: PQQ-dependent sugar dehydrogenase [Planctomycetota bacterium]